LPHKSVRALLAEADRSLWIGTVRGFCLLRDGHITAFDAGKTLNEASIAVILDDELSHLWLGSNRGVFRVARAELEAVVRGEKKRVECAAYTRSDGLTSEECSAGQPAGLRTHDGRLWFATVQGLSVVDPRQVPTNTVPPPVVIEKVLVDGKSAIPNPQSAILTVPAGRRRVEIRYTGLSFTAPERVRFKQPLEGFDEDWREVGEERVASFLGLPPGNYGFRVIAANNDGVWNNQGASLALVVQPGWWQTWWFRGSLAGVFVSAGPLIYLRRVRHLQRARAALEAFSRQLIQQQEAERKRIAGELHDGLGQALLIVKNTASMAADPAAAPDEMRADLATITRLSAQALEEVRAITHALRPPELDRLGLTRTIEHVVRLAADASGLQCSLELDPLDGLLSPSSEIQLYRLVQECLNNVVKHARASYVEVRARRDGRVLRASVRDNGEGFDPAERGRSSSGPGGLGLAGMAERVRLLGGEITVRSQPGSGTVVEAWLPMDIEPHRNPNDG